MKLEYLKKWRKLDNTAKIFSLDKEKNTNIFRYSIILKQKINKNILKEALNKTLEQYNSFKVKLGTGLFWNFLEYNPKEPLIEKEDDIPCSHIDFKENNDYLFKVTYYKKKINLDMFHVLTDGAGASNFLKSIIYNYLNIKHKLNNKIDLDNKITHQDQYLKNYDKKIKSKLKDKFVYQIKEKINTKINNTNHYIMNIKEVKEVCKKFKVTITEYLTAIYIYAIYSSIYKKKSKKEISITLPINLRKYYEVDTLSNFFTCANINPKMIENKLVTFEDVLKAVHKEFEEKLEVNRVKSYLTRDVKLGKSIAIRLVPLRIKKLFITSIIRIAKKTTTSTLSNVGIIDINTNYKKYIDNILVLVIPNKVEKVKCTICSYNNKLNVTINSNIENNKLENRFLELLKEHIKNIKLESNINYIK